MRGFQAAVFSVLMIWTCSVEAQELAKPIDDPVPDGALNPPPAFGSSRPTDAPLPAHEAPKTPATTTADWSPKLVVKLRTTPPGNPKAKVDHAPLQRDRHPSIDVGDDAILKCDDVQVEVKTDDNGTPVYSVNCKGKAIISVGGNTITADSIATVDGKLSATNAVVEMPNKVFVRSEKLSIEMTVFEVEVKSAREEVRKPSTSAESAPRFFNGDEPFLATP